jgi:hypothetical protein
MSGRDNDDGLPPEGTRGDRSKGEKAETEVSQDRRAKFAPASASEILFLTSGVNAHLWQELRSLLIGGITDTRLRFLKGSLLELRAIHRQLNKNPPADTLWLDGLIDVLDLQTVRDDKRPRAYYHKMMFNIDQGHFSLKELVDADRAENPYDEMHEEHLNYSTNNENNTSLDRKPLRRLNAAGARVKSSTQNNWRIVRKTITGIGFAAYASLWVAGAYFAGHRAYLAQHAERSVAKPNRVTMSINRKP